LVRRGAPGGLLARQEALLADRAALDAGLARLPQTLCHRDATTRNVLVRPRGGGTETVAIDWAHAGPGPLGRDLAQLVPSGVHGRDVDPRGLREVDAVAFPAYLGGLRDSGWRGGEALVRFGYCACGAMHYGLFLLGVTVLDDARRAQMEASFGLPVGDLLDLLAEEQRFCMDLGDEARALLPAVLRA
jgi:hypothetical protein